MDITVLESLFHKCVLLIQYFYVRSRLIDKSIKCLDRSDVRDQIKHLKISKKSSRSNIYLHLNITSDKIVCQNNNYSINDLCKNKIIKTKTTCKLKNGNSIDL